MLNFLFCILLSFLCLCHTKAQNPENKAYLIKGSVTDSATLHPVSFAQIYNESTKTGVSANDSGFFFITVKKGDTLVIVDVAYWSKVLLIDSVADNQELDIYLNPQFHEIEEVDVTRIRTYKQFQQQILHHELEVSETVILKENLTSQSKKEAITTAQMVENDRNTQPGQTRIYSIPFYYKAERQRRNYQKVLKLQEKQNLIDEKYNREIIYEITQLSEDETTDFIGFCNFKMSFLLESSEYEIREEIEKKFKEFRLK